VTEAPPPNGTLHGAIARVSQTLISALPPAFLLLCLINAAFMAVVLWFLDDQLDQRTLLVKTLVERCLDIAYHAQPPLK
jgi:hypothetical protein